MDTAAIDALYARLPTLACKGHCAESCGPIACSSDEAARMAAAGGAPLTFNAGTMTCHYLDTVNRRCTVYAVRPLICRLWGTTPFLFCPWGCAPAPAPLPDLAARALLAEMRVIAGPDVYADPK